jgi:hypothetical protein
MTVDAEPEPATDVAVPEVLCCAAFSASSVDKFPSRVVSVVSSDAVPVVAGFEAVLVVVTVAELADDPPLEVTLFKSFRVCGPVYPTAANPFVCWSHTRAAFVCVPKYPVGAVLRYPYFSSVCWSCNTCEPEDPTASVLLMTVACAENGAMLIRAMSNVGKMICNFFMLVKFQVVNRDK